MLVTAIAKTIMFGFVAAFVLDELIIVPLDGESERVATAENLMAVCAKAQEVLDTFAALGVIRH